MNNLENETLKICKTRKVKTPNRAHPGDAGIDFFVPEDLTIEVVDEKCKVTGCTPTMDFDSEGFLKTIMLKPNQSILIPCGIKMKVPYGWMLQFTNKSGISSKRHLIVGANCVDFDYMGECHINLHNVGEDTAMISAGDKIVQGILIPVGLSQVEDVGSEEALYGNETSARGAGGFGSSGTK